jgi:hypothetical protein
MSFEKSLKSIWHDWHVLCAQTTLLLVGEVTMKATSLPSIASGGVPVAPERAAQRKVTALRSRSCT